MYKMTTTNDHNAFIDRCVCISYIDFVRFAKQNLYPKCGEVSMLMLSLDRREWVSCSMPNEAFVWNITLNVTVKRKREDSI